MFPVHFKLFIKIIINCNFRINIRVTRNVTFEKRYTREKLQKTYANTSNVTHDYKSILRALVYLNKNDFNSNKHTRPTTKTVFEATL